MIQELILIGSIIFVRNTQDATIPQALPKDMLITLERTGCEGTCPIYKLSIYRDGKVVYGGKEFVRQKGTIHAKISREKLKELISEFERVGYFALKQDYTGLAECPEYATDNPWAITSIRINGKTKTVRHNYGCRGIAELKDLFVLERKIDEVAGTDRWVK